MRKWRYRHVRWTVRLIVIGCVIGYLRLVGLDGKFYYPDDVVYVLPDELGLDYEEVAFRAADGTALTGWFLPAQRSAKGLVVHFHGNAANVSNHLPLVEWLPRAGYHLLMFDYRGYGRSEGHPDRTGTIRDGHAAVDYARSRPEAAGLPLLVYGQSLGAAVATIVTAERTDIDALVLESPFSDHRRIAAMHARRLVRFDWLARTLARLTISDGHDPIDFVHLVAPRPLLVIAAENDRICFPELARELYDAAREPKLFWLAPRAEHLDIIGEHAAELEQRITSFFEQAAQTRPRSAPSR